MLLRIDGTLRLLEVFVVHFIQGY